MEKNYYKTLGVPDTASEMEIKAKYVELVAICHPSAPFGSERLFNEVTEAYHVILAQMANKRKKEPNEIKYSLQRVQVKAALTRALKLDGIKRLISGMMATVMLLALVGCSDTEKPIDTGNINSGYSLNNTDWLGEIENTSDYFLIKLDNTLHLTKRTEKKEYLTTDYYCYYDIRTGEFVGLSQDLNESIIISSEEEPSLALTDFEFLKGAYGYGNNIPYTSIIPLTAFISSEKPSAEDIEFWSGNSESAQLAFENLMLFDTTRAFEKTWEDGEVTNCEYTNPLSRFECTKRDGEVQTLVGYRASHSTEDIGYNYVYNVFDGAIYYIGSSREDAFLQVSEIPVENGKTIKELREIYGVEFVYVNIGDEFEGIEDAEPIDGSTNDDGEPSASDHFEEPDAIEEEEFDWVVNAGKIDTFKDVLVVDVVNMPKASPDFPNELPDGLKYVFIAPTEDLLAGIDYVNPLDYTASVFFSSNSLVFDYYSDNIKVVSAFEVFAGDYIYTIDSFLESRGMSEEIRSEYTVGELAKLDAQFNDYGYGTVPADEIVVVEMSPNSETPRYLIMKKVGEQYVDISNKNGRITPVMNGMNYESEDEVNYRYVHPLYDELSCEVKPVAINSFLAEHDFDSLIRDTYDGSELFVLYDAINGAEMRPSGDVKAFKY